MIKYKSIDDYIATFPEHIQEILEELRAAIQKAAPSASETISYQIPTFTLNGNLVHFAAYKNHIGFYPTSSGILAFKKELSIYEGSKGAVRFPLDKPLPLKLISKIVKFRIKENLRKKERKAAKKKSSVIPKNLKIKKTSLSLLFLITSLLFSGPVNSQEKKASITLQNYKSFENAYKLENDSLELVVVTDIGPRILYFGLKKGENLFHEIGYTKEQLKENKWRNYGGHRLWIAPEDKIITYQPDNFPASAIIKEQKLKITQKEDPITKTVKEIEIRLHPSKPYAEITHKITNNGDKDFELSAWALSVLKQGGRAILPLGKKGTHPEDLLPNYSINLWPYTKLGDPCWKIDSDYIQLNTKEKCDFPQKIGSSGTGGWIAYEINSVIFFKSYQYYGDSAYPDKNSSAEIFSNGKFIELETLSPLKVLKPKESLEHVEYWAILNAKDFKTAEPKILKLKQKMIDSFK